MAEHGLSHIDDSGNAGMVDVSGKKITLRTAVAEAQVTLPTDIVSSLRQGNELASAKGPVFHTARIAGIQAAKKTGGLIPLCHPVGLDSCEIAIELKENIVFIQSTCRLEARTGVEMEALTSASVAALTIYDMCKALSHNIILGPIRLMEKSGGKRHFKRDTSH